MTEKNSESSDGEDKTEEEEAPSVEVQTGDDKVGIVEIPTDASPRGHNMAMKQAYDDTRDKSVPMEVIDYLGEYEGSFGEVMSKVTRTWAEQGEKLEDGTPITIDTETKEKKMRRRSTSIVDKTTDELAGFIDLRDNGLTKADNYEHIVRKAINRLRDKLDELEKTMIQSNNTEFL